VRTRRIKVGVAIISISTASLFVGGINGGEASAAVRANSSTFCKELRHDNGLNLKVTTAHQLSSVVSLLRQLANDAPHGLKNELNSLARAMQRIGRGKESKSQASADATLADKLQSQANSACGIK
jgi:hypothetical protein